MKTLAQTASTALLIGSLALATACAKKPVAKNTPAPPPATPAPTVTFSASPSMVHPGDAAELTWKTENATEINISGIGTVPATGSRSVSPTESTTYSLAAKGPGGSADADARVTVQPVPVASKVETTEEDINSLFARNVKDVYFDYDKYVIRGDQSSINQANATFLKEHANVGIVIEGHCDERGSEEYNLSLGDARANAVKAELVKLGIAPERIRTVSYGKEHPFCTTDGENCWSQNRRDHFVAAVSH